VSAFYASAWHHPGVAWAANAALLAIGVRAAAPRLRGFLVVAAIVAMLDAWLTGALAPAFAKEYAQAIGIVFVIAGDLRYFYLLERLTGRRRAFTVAALIALIVPLWQTAIMKTWPGPFQSQRVIFLSYEALFVLVAVGLWQRYYAARAQEQDQATAAFLWRLTAFEIVQYTLWATIDVLLLAGHEWALVLRMIPDILYYGGFLWFCSLQSRSLPIPPR
jgi:hypothetical protein